MIDYTFREMTTDEFSREQRAFDEHGLEFGNLPEKAERYSYVATKKGKFIGTSSGLAQKTEVGYQKYFFLTDLLVEKEFRKQGHGEKLLRLLEEKIVSSGIEYIWTWTAGYEAPEFYKKQGYQVFSTFENWYQSGHSRVGLIKKLR